QDEVGLEVSVQVVMESVGVVGAEVGLDTADRQVHLGQAPGCGVGLLAEDRDVAEAAAVLANELLALDEHAARPAAGVVHPAPVRLDQLHQEPHDRTWGIELAALLAHGAGELAEEVLVDAPEDVIRAADGSAP